MAIRMAPLIAHFGSPVMVLPGRMFTPCRKKTKPARKTNTLKMDNRIFIRCLDAYRLSHYGVSFLKEFVSWNQDFEFT